MKEMRSLSNEERPIIGQVANEVRDAIEKLLKEKTIGEPVSAEGASMGLFNIDELENVDIEFDMGIELRKNVELAVEKEAKEYDDEFSTVAALEAISSLKAPQQLAELKGKAVRFDKVASKDDMAQVVFDMLGI